ncbi:MAG: membrane protein insertase YidC, partial [Parvibaculales bacterium]
MNDQNNFLMAIILSLAVLLGWQFFVTEPRLAEERARQQKLENTSPTTDNATARADGLAANMAPQADGQIAQPQVAANLVTEGFAEAPRLAIETPQLTGSIALMGARFDDLVLTAYGADARENAPRQVLLQREGQKGHWQAQHGFVAAPGSKVTLPDEKTVWQASGDGALTPSTPVTLRHVTPEGLVLSQTISV